MDNNNFSKNRINFLREASTLLQNNHLDEALNLAAERLRHYPADTDAWGVYCEALIGMGRLEEMRELLNEVAQVISGLNLIYERAGDACRENGFHREAANCYEKFISLRPETEKSREIIEKMALLEQEAYSSTENNFTDDQNISEEEFYTLTMAQLYIEQGHLHDAEKILEEIIKQDPLHTQAQAMLEELRYLLLPKSSGEEQSLTGSRVMEALLSWLRNIERLKINAAEKSRG